MSVKPDNELPKPSNYDSRRMFDPVEPQASIGMMFLTFGKLAAPAIVTNILSFMCNINMVIFAGRMEDPINVAVIGLAISCTAIMMLAIMIGLNMAQETLTSQAYGANDLRLCGLYLNRGSVILLAFFIPLATLPSIFAEDIFIRLGQDTEVSALTAV